MPFNGLGQFYQGTPLDVGGNLLKGAEAASAMKRTKLYDIQAKKEQMALDDAMKMQKAVNLYGDYGTAPGVGPADIRQMYQDQGLPLQGQQVINKAQSLQQESPAMKQLQAAGVWALDSKDDNELNSKYDTIKSHASDNGLDTSQWPKSKLEGGKGVTREYVSSFLGGPEESRKVFETVHNKRMLADVRKQAIAAKKTGSSQMFAQKLLSPFKNDISGDIDPETGTSMRSYILDKVTQDLDAEKEPIDIQNNISQYMDEYNSKAAATIKAKREADKNKPGFFKGIVNSMTSAGRTAPAPAGGGKQLDPATATELLQEAGGNKNKARQLAKQRGYTF